MPPAYVPIYVGRGLVAFAAVRAAVTWRMRGAAVTGQVVESTEADPASIAEVARRRRLLLRLLLLLGYNRRLLAQRICKKRESWLVGGLCYAMEVGQRDKECARVVSKLMLL